jgi:dienelactone hydrolase
MQRVAHAYAQDGVAFDGAVVKAGEDARPGVLVIHGWEGRSDGQERFAGKLAELGYAAVCVDLYGDGRRGTTPDVCQALMDPLLADRALLRRRLLGAVEAAAGLGAVDAARMAAVGFCFGGLCAIDLARANAPLKGVVSFHGALTAYPGPPPTRIDVPLLVAHGWDDPMAPPADVLALAAELTAARADWQLHAYGATMHAFMAEGLNQPERGIQYNARSARRAWAAMAGFLAETV